jgi:hypothetical protein
MRGEVATPSKVPYDVRLLPLLEFGLKLSATGTPKTVVLRTHGLELAALEEMAELQTEIAGFLGPLPRRRSAEDSLDPDVQAYLEEALEWWIQHGTRQYPLRAHKFHRVYEALLQATFAGRLVPKEGLVAFFGSFLFCVRTPLEAMTFQPSKRGGDKVFVTATRAAQTLEEHELLATVMAVYMASLRSFAALAEKFAASALNVGKMLYGPRVKLEGGDSNLVIKLFTAATSWGCGTSGWKQFDQTASITGDQGRLLWRPEDTSACTSCAAEDIPQQKKPRKSSGCPCRRRTPNGTAVDVPTTLSTMVIIFALVVAAARYASSS